MFRNKKVIKIILYAAVLTVLYCLPVKNEYIRQFILICEILLIFSISRTAYFLIIKPYVKFWVRNAKGFMKASVDYMRAIFKPILDRIRGSQKRNYIKGTDEQKMIFNFGIADSLKSNLGFRKKLAYKSNLSNAEKIRFFYIKYILTLIKSKRTIKYSYTPKEIKDAFRCDNDDILFETYEQIRYNKSDSVDVSNDTVELCKDVFKK